MKMKNVLMILIALAVVFTMAGVVSATTNYKNIVSTTGEDTDGEFTVKYSLGKSYLVQIPPEVTIAGPNMYGEFTGSGFINVTNLLIDPADYLHVNLTSGNVTAIHGIYNLVNDGTSFISYYINYTRATASEELPVINTDDILVVEAGNVFPGLEHLGGTASIGNYTTLKFKTTTTFIQNATKSGVHQDVLNFHFYINENSEYYTSSSTTTA